MPAALEPFLRRALSRRGVLETVAHAGDPREPARLVAAFASPGAPERRATLLFVHGKGGAPVEWRVDAVRALRLGYNVLVPTLRAHAPSTGERVTHGLLESVDLRLLLDEAGRRFGIDRARVGLDGCSMGAMVALQTAASAPVAALWLQSPFARLREMAIHYAHRATGLPPALLALPTALALAAAERASGLPLGALDPLAAARRVACPTALVHGADDRHVPERFSRPFEAALPNLVAVWRAPRCGHCHHPDDPETVRRAEYGTRWTRFFSTHLPSAPSRVRRSERSISSGR